MLRLLLRVVDAIREMLANIEATGGEGAGEHASLIAELDRLRGLGANDDPSEAARQPANALFLPANGAEAHTVEFAANQPLAEAQPDAPALAFGNTPTASAVSPRPRSFDQTIWETPSAVPKSIPAKKALAPVPETVGTETSEGRASSAADATIRVDVGLLDKLMTLVGELVLSRNQIVQYSESHEDAGFLSATQRLNLLTTELQTSVMKTRMQPIGSVWGKFPRVVRDLALACGKQVRFEMEGQETELDKTLTESIRDPLTHMIRNAVDHGIETPEARQECGKPPEGRLRIVAFHEGGKVIIEITDDGGGIDLDRVREKAIIAKLVSPDDAARMSPRELLGLLFLPGFSTTDRVTQFSGRGVGMDVVRTNIEKIGGTVDIESSPGRGTTIRTKIPLTLAIIPALIVVCGGERYAIPQVNLLELVWLDADQAQRGVEWIQGVPVYRLRGNLLPLVFLDEQLRLDEGGGARQELNLVVLQADDRPFGLVVDAIRDTEEIVVKPLQKQLKGVSAFAGAAIMGDGRIALILDVLGLAKQAGVISAAKGRGMADKEPAPQQAQQQSDSLLLFTPSAGGQMAIPLSLVARLEEIPRVALERVGAGLVVQYRGEILPLLDVSRELDRLERDGWRISAPDAMNAPMNRDVTVSDTISVVVCAEGARQLGLMVSQILDIVEDPISARLGANRPGVLFTAVIQGKVTEFVDVARLLRAATMELPQPVA